MIEKSGRRSIGIARPLFLFVREMQFSTGSNTQQEF
jgi:hypothetical protein